MLTKQTEFKWRIWLRGQYTLTLLLMLFTFAASAQSLPWANREVATVQIISPHKKGQALYSGIDIRLDKGWKTYWRSPGTGGIPPEIIDLGSDNLAAITMLYPAPNRYKTPYGDYFGYSEKVRFPIKITPINPERAVTLKLGFRYGACLDVCRPLDVELYQKIPAGISPYNQTIAKALENINQPLPASELNAVSSQIILGQGTHEKSYLDISVRPNPKLGTLIDLLVESRDKRLSGHSEIIKNTEAVKTYRQLFTPFPDARPDKSHQDSGKGLTSHKPLKLTLTLIYEKNAQRRPYEMTLTR